MALWACGDDEKPLVQHGQHTVLAIPEGRRGRFSIRHEPKPAGEVFQTAPARSALFGQSGGPVAWDRETVWHQLHGREGLWMTDYPVEQRQMRELARDVRGRVLVGGLGLGFLPTVLAAKRAVREIVVVEKSPQVVSLVWPHLSAAVRRKAVVVEADLLEYLKRPDTGPGQFDHGLYDIWQMDGEATFHHLVVPLRRLSVGVVHDVRCWQEDVMRGQLHMALFGRLMMLGADIGNGAKLTSDELAKPRRMVFHDWAVPFWEWHRRHAPNLDEAKAMARLYARTYGLNGLTWRSAEWRRRWV